MAAMEDLVQGQGAIFIRCSNTMKLNLETTFLDSEFFGFRSMETLNILC